MLRNCYKSLRTSTASEANQLHVELNRHGVSTVYHIPEFYIRYFGTASKFKA